MIKPKQLGRLGTFFLHEAILDVLLDNHKDVSVLGLADISRRTGIFREHKPGDSGFGDAIVAGCLNELHAQGKIQSANKGGGKRRGWRLTEKEYERRREDG